MTLSHPAADIVVPDGSPLAVALARTTHLCIAAHQDDIVIMAYHGIAECQGSTERWFTGAAVTWAMDLTPQVHDESLSIEQFTVDHIDRLRADVAARLKKFG